jgi:hypothetical protein
MTAILYGNLSVEIVSSLGARIERATLRQDVSDMLSPQHPEVLPGPPMLGREQESRDALAAIQSGQPVGFYAACGFGKTTLLQYLIATASQRDTAASCVYLRADGRRCGDVLQQLVARLYRPDRPVKLTPAQCARLLGQVSAVIAIDDVSAGPDEVGRLLDTLPACSVVIGSTRPVLGKRGISQKLPGLSAEAALALLADDLARPLTGEELEAAGRLATAVEGQPLRLRQAAALVREGRHSVDSLARMATGDPDVLDRLSIDALAEHERRALAVLALVAGALLPAAVVATIGQLAYLGQCLESLHRRGLAEQRDDRFGLPVCKAGSYRRMLLKDLDLAASARELGGFLAAADHTTAECHSAAEAALVVLEFAAELGDWPTVARLARAAEPVLFIAGRWEAWHDVLGTGLEAARATAASADRTAEAFFSHQLGSLAFCQDRLEDAARLLRHALTIREQAGDHEGAELTRHNLHLLEPPAPPIRPRLRHLPRRLLRPLAGVLAGAALVAGTAALAGTVRGSGPSPPAHQVGGRTSSAPPTTAATSGSPSVASTSSPSTSPPQPPSSGPGTRLVPDVVGKSPAAAGTTLINTGLSVGSQTQLCSDTIGPGLVSATSPRAETQVAEGYMVDLVESSGPCPVVVPSVLGQTSSTATATLQARGLAVNPATTAACDTGANGTVVSEDPPSGQFVKKNSTVTITVCSILVPVPDVLNLSQAGATKTLRYSGFTVTAESTTQCKKPNIVASQNPQAKTSASYGSLVTITMCAR